MRSSHSSVAVASELAPAQPAPAPAQPAPARSTRREDQTRETRRRLIGAAIALVTEVGWRRTTVEQIAERAGVAKGTFFVHFKTKESIVVALVQKQIAAASAARDAVLATGGSAVDRLEVATLTLGGQAAANIELSRAVLVASLESREVGGATDAVFTQLQTRMIEDAREGLAKGLLHGPDAETIAALLLACYLGAALHCASAPTAKPLNDVLRPLVSATIAALTAGARGKTKTKAKTTKTRARSRAKGGAE